MVEGRLLAVLMGLSLLEDLFQTVSNILVKRKRRDDPGIGTRRPPHGEIRYEPEDYVNRH